MGDYKSMNNKAKFILVGREMNGRALTAVYLFNRQTCRRERVNKSRFMSMAEHDSIANCKASGGVLFGLQCNIRDIPVYDKKTGMIRSGAYTEEQIISLVEGILNTHKVIVIAKYRYQDKIVSYLIKDLTTGNELKYSKEAMYKAYSKGYLQNCKVTISNGEIKVFDGDILNIPIIDIDSKGNIIDKKAQKIEEEIKKEQKVQEKQIKSEKVLEKTLESRIRKAVERDEKKTPKYNIISVIISCITNYPTAYIIQHIESGEQHNIPVSDFEKWADRLNSDTSHSEKIYRNNKDEIDRVVSAYFINCNTDKDIQTRMKNIISLDAMIHMNIEEVNTYLDDINNKVNLDLDFKIKSVTYYIEKHTFKIKSIIIERNGKSATINEANYESMWVNKVVNGPSIDDLLAEPLKITDEYKIFIYNNEEIGFAVQELTNTYDISELSLKRLTKSIKNIINNRKSVGLNTLKEMIDFEYDKIQRKDLDFLKKRYAHCISEVDIKNLRTQLLSNIQSGGGSLFCDINTNLKADIVPFSGRKTLRDSMKHCIFDEVLYIGTKEHYALALTDLNWVDLLSYVLINLSLVYGSYMDVRISDGKDTIIDANISISSVNTIKMREALENNNYSLSEIQNMLYNHIDPELIRRIGISRDFIPTEHNMKPIYLT